MKTLLLQARSLVLKYVLPVVLICLAVLGFTSVRRKAQASTQPMQKDTSKEILVEQQADKADAVNQAIKSVSEPVKVVVPKDDATVDELVDTYNKL